MTDISDSLSIKSWSSPHIITVDLFKREREKRLDLLRQHTTYIIIYRELRGPRLRGTQL